MAFLDGNRFLFSEQALDFSQDAARVLGHVFQVQFALHGLDDGFEQAGVQLNAQNVGHDLGGVLFELFDQVIVARQLGYDLLHVFGDVLAHGKSLLFFLFYWFPSTLIVSNIL